MGSITMDRITELADKQGVTFDFLNDLIGGYRGKTTGWKTGRLAPTFSELNTLASYFNVSLDYLLGHVDNPQPASGKVRVQVQSSVTPPAEPESTQATGFNSYLFLADGAGGRKITIPPDKVFRVLKLIEAAFPELVE